MGQAWDRTTVPHNTGAVSLDTLCAGSREEEPQSQPTERAAVRGRSEGEVCV